MITNSESIYLRGEKRADLWEVIDCSRYQNWSRSAESMKDFFFNFFL